MMDVLLKDVEELAKKNINDRPYLNMFLQYLSYGDELSCYKIILGNAYYLKKRGINFNPLDVEKKANCQSIRYHKNNILASDIHYKDGNLHGEYRTYYDNGKVKTSCRYINNKIHGLFLSYKDNGKVRKIISYDNGNIIK